MGFNTTVLILNDELSAIEQDKDFGRMLVKGILNYRYEYGYERPYIPHQTTVIETHHADNTALIAVGGNCATRLLLWHGLKHREIEDQVELLKALADKLGYNIRKKPK